MNLFVDTSVWSLALRRDSPPLAPHVAFVRNALEAGDAVFTTGLVLQELLQGVSGPKFREAIVQRFAALPFLVPEREDHVRAATVHTACSHTGIQVTTLDTLLAALCIRHGLTMLSTDQDFAHIARIEPLKVWKP
ncbi:MAG: PIN domain-containing protein [Gemmatimonadetes bacterium]|nr:PIN domain-containing protein [Gemmatimonadota bacterium]